jgi:hypothetical protein
MFLQTLDAVLDACCFWFLFIFFYTNRNTKILRALSKKHIFLTGAVFLSPGKNQQYIVFWNKKK